MIHPSATCVKCGKLLTDDDRQTAKCGAYPARYLCREHVELVNGFLNARIELEDSLPIDPTPQPPRRGA